ncbi:MAG: PAS domain-containing protein [Elusimicrobia bacterium]|nr:PAS domain-containing protein [Candidatus Liberimonas magnetica]
MKYLTSGSIFYKTILFFAVIIIIILAYIFGFYLLPLKEQALKDNVFEKVNAISNLSEPVITKALRNQDDISLLSQIEKMMKVSDISTVYVLDSTGTVVSHDRTGEWGKVYKDAITKKILLNRKISLYKSSEGYLYATPLISSKTLIIGISTYKTDTRYDLIKKNALYVSLTIFVLAMLFFTLFLIVQFRLQLKNLGELLTSVNAGTMDRIEIDNNNEVSEISLLINELIDKYKTQEKTVLAKISQLKENDMLLIRAVSENLKNGIIVTNSDNKVIYLNKEISAILSIKQEDCIGKHILDVLDKPQFIDVLKKSTENLNVTVEDSVDNKPLKLITVGNSSKEILGTIITAD